MIDPLRNVRTTLGEFREDLATTLPLNSELKFYGHRLQIENVGDSVPVGNWDSLHGTLLSIHFANKTSHVVLGSGLLVAPGVAITAKHVVDGYFDAVMASEVQIFCFAVCAHGINIWIPKQISFVGNSDIVILTMSCNSTLPPGGLFALAGLSTRRPAVGETLKMIGFQASDIVDRINISGQAYLSNGIVTEIYPTGRDSVMMPWPCFEVACATVGSMSGGPVIDKYGLVVGILSTGFESQDTMGPSYVSMLWPALTAMITPSWPPGLFRSEVSLWSMNNNLCWIDHREALSLEGDENTGVIITKYNPWNDG